MVMVDNLAEKIDKCPLNQHRYVYCLCTIGSVKVFVAQISGVSAIQGFHCIEVCREMVGNCQLYRWYLLLMGVH